MVQSQYSLSWSDYKSNICNGFSSLQQNGEMVDMTLAADGHMVKVHQVLLALSSPYLKELITSAPCQHPVIFLNDVSYRTLTALLEYIYTGEVLVAAENLNNFVKTAQSLHIRGLEDLSVDENMHVKFEGSSRLEDISTCHISGTKRMMIPEMEGGQVDLPASARKVYIKRQKTSKILPGNQNVSMGTSLEDFGVDDTPADNDSDDNYEQIEHDSSITKQPKTEGMETGQLQYSVSIRGSLQVILNRYIYNIQNTSRSGMRRWRCIDYRNRKCLAFLITKGNVVLNRANLHNHAFHDKKILQKIEKKAVYSAITDVEGYKEMEEDATMEQEESYDFDESADETNK